MEGKWTVVRLRLLASTICGISQYFEVLCSLQHFWGGYHIIYYAVVVVCKACVFPCQVSCYSSVEDAVTCRNPTLAKCEDETHTPKVGDLESSGTPECLEFDSNG
jgi:hypothetical protein